MGLNAVRIPFGFWIVDGPGSAGGAFEPWEGPALAFLDRAVQWAEDSGLQVLLGCAQGGGPGSGRSP